MKRGRWLLYVLPITIVSLGSIGFAASKGWDINPQIEASFNFGADEVATFNQRFAINSAVQATGFTEEGVTTKTTVGDSKKTVTYVDSSNPLQPLDITIKFDFEGGDKTMQSYMPANATGFTLLTVLEDENTSLGLYSVAKISTAKLTYNSKTELTGNKSSDNAANSYLFALSSFPYRDQESVSFSVTFTIEFNDDIDYKNDVYSKLDGDESTKYLKYSLYVGAVGWTY